MPGKGVSYVPRWRRWYARIWVKGKRISLGYYDDEAEAARAYERKAVGVFRQLARRRTAPWYPPRDKRPRFAHK